MSGERASAAPQPLAGVRVIEFTHMVMGPTCGMVLADLGAEVIKVEPVGGEHTRSLLGSGAGFFPMFNRNKKSIEVDLRSEAGAEVARALCVSADVVVENFRPGTMEQYGLDHASLSAANPRLIHVSAKGFLPGPYEHRTALDEVVQMMGGLAYMTGRPGDPLRAGTSVNDIMGGMFGAIGVLGALLQRGITGRGMAVQSALFENNVFLVGQHMLQYAMTGRPAAPMPERISAWAIYDVFTVRDGGQIFLAAVSDAQWAVFCDVLGFDDLKADPALATNNQRVLARPSLLPLLRERRDLRARGAAVRADQPARGPVRRPAPRADRRARRRRRARRTEGGRNGQGRAPPVHDGRRAPRRAARPAAPRRAHRRGAALDRPGRGADRGAARGRRHRLRRASDCATHPLRFPV
jgi:crotonobetainyl-CoA:carnitine CoA-transferase CaiB-like acyl-CoA transferase